MREDDSRMWQGTLQDRHILRDPNRHGGPVRMAPARRGLHPSEPAQTLPVLARQSRGHCVGVYHAQRQTQRIPSRGNDQRGVMGWSRSGFSCYA